MDWRKRIFGVHPLEVTGPGVGSDAPWPVMDWRMFEARPLKAERVVPDQSSDDSSSFSSVDSDLEISSEGSFILQPFSCTEESPEPSSPTSGRHVTPLVHHPSFMEPPSPPRPRPGHRVTEVAEAVPSHRLDSTGPEPVIQPVTAAQDVEDDGRRQDCGDEELLEPASSMQDPSMEDLTTTFFPEPPQQEDTALPTPSTNTQGRYIKRLTTRITTIFPPSFRSRRRGPVLDLQGTTPESEPVPAAQRGRLRRFLAFFRRMVRRR